METIPIENFDMEGKEGRKSLRLEVAHLPDNSTISLPLGFISNGVNRKICVLSGQHGNEWNGIYTAQKLFKKLNFEEVRGTLFFLPIANPPAFNEKSRVSSIDSIDLNRTYLNGEYRKPTERIGKILFDQLFSEMDCIIDLHGGGPGEYSPHVAIADEDYLEKSKNFLLPDIQIESKTPGSLAAACVKKDISCFTVEAGQHRNINTEYVKSLLEGLENFLKSENVLEGESREEKPDVHRNKEGLPSPVSGFFESEISLGARVEEDDKMGSMEQLFGEKIPIKSTVSGKVLYIRREEVVSSGENLFHIVW